MTNLVEETSSWNGIRDAFFSRTYDDYFSASQRVSDESNEKEAVNVKPYNAYSLANISTLLTCAAKLLYAITIPFVVTIIAAYVFAVSRNMNPFTLSLLVISVYPVLRHFYGVVIKSRIGRFLRPFHSRYAPGLFASDDMNTQRLLHLCPSLRHDSVVYGDLYEAKSNSIVKSTPWLLSGDFRTLLPFLSVHPPTVQYQRRWVRVPLSDHNGVCTEEKEGSTEAVALDWLPATPDSSSNDNSPVKAVFLLAGLTGGSQEGYVKDFAYHAQSQGIHVFVMIGRGLQQTPLKSDSMFHGARISDALACVKMVRSALGKEATLLAVGISMGGFIVSNALVKSSLGEYVDGVVNVAGCFETIANMYFRHSRELWQPLLAFGLKEAFVGAPKGWEVVQKRFAAKTQPSDENRNSVHERCSEIVDNLVDVLDFDSVMVTGIHGYPSVEDYYADMSAAPAMRKIAESTPKESLKFAVPHLVLHAVDDPIIHVNTLPQDPDDATRPWIWGNHIVLLTAMGGHMGWPVGLFPWLSGFRFSNTIITDFMNGIHEMKLSPNQSLCDIKAASSTISLPSLRDATIE